MRREDFVLGLNIVCAITSVVGVTLTASIALGYNRHISSAISRKFRHFRPDYDGADHPQHPPDKEFPMWKN